MIQARKFPVVIRQSAGSFCDSLELLLRGFGRWRLHEKSFRRNSKCFLVGYLV